MVVITNTITGIGVVRPNGWEEKIARRCTLLHNGHDSRVYLDRDGNRLRVSVA